MKLLATWVLFQRLMPIHILDLHKLSVGRDITRLHRRWMHINAKTFFVTRKTVMVDLWQRRQD